MRGRVPLLKKMELVIQSDREWEEDHAAMKLEFLKEKTRRRSKKKQQEMKNEKKKKKGNLIS